MPGIQAAAKKKNQEFEDKRLVRKEKHEKTLAREAEYETTVSFEDNKTTIPLHSPSFIKRITGPVISGLGDAFKMITSCSTPNKYSAQIIDSTSIPRDGK